MMELKCQIANQVKLNAILCLSISLLKLQPKVIQTLDRVTLLESRTELRNLYMWNFTLSRVVLVCTCTIESQLC